MFERKARKKLIIIKLLFLSSIGVSSLVIVVSPIITRKNIVEALFENSGFLFGVYKTYGRPK